MFIMGLGGDADRTPVKLTVYNSVKLFPVVNLKWCSILI